MNLLWLIFVAALLATSFVDAQDLQGVEILKVIEKYNNPSEVLTFKGHQVLTVNVRNKNELKQLSRIVEKYYLDTWTELKVGNVDIRVPPEFKDAVRKAIVSPTVVKIADLEQTIINSKKEPEMQIQSTAVQEIPNIDFFKDYHTYDELSSFVRKLNKDHPNITELVSAGKTYEGRDMFGLRIKGKNAKKKFVFHGGIHAREWISPATVTYITNALVGLYEKDQKIKNIVDNYDIYVVPIMNADGYVFTQQNRMWRKNRQPNRGSNCIGTDLNRNWNHPSWSGPGASSNPCNELYYGSSAASTTEVKNMAKFIAAAKPDVYIDFHSYGQQWMWAYAYKCNGAPPNINRVAAAGKAGVNALKAVHNTVYEYGPLCTTLYQASGASVDWANDVAKIPYSYTIELRDTGRNGFVLPRGQIIPSGEETLAGVIALLEHVLNNS
ncbi:uncharacterized protein VTP21DRAFT_7453 [Calcarisporiella thermophila]|uniref:uncharacterized protein n=1 Tax=Calcarisporiella thermophila TaxID=911321 RepID=UPI0037445D16